MGDQTPPSVSAIADAINVSVPPERILRAASSSGLYDEIDWRDASGEGITVTHYHFVDLKEMNGAGVPAVDADEGTFWYGADDSSYRSLFFIPKNGSFTLRVAESAPRARSQDEIAELAIGIARALNSQAGGADG